MSESPPTGHPWWKACCTATGARPAVRRLLESSIALLIVIGAVGACSRGDSGAVAGPESGADQVESESTVESNLSEAMGSDLPLPPGDYLVAGNDLELLGSFRTRRQFKVVSEGATPRREVSIEEEYWVDLHELVSDLEPASGRAVVPSGALSIELDIRPDGRMFLEFVRPSPGLMAINAGTRGHGKPYTKYAVAAESRQPLEFVRNGIPPPQVGSLVCRFDGFLDMVEVVASRLNVTTHEGQGQVAVRVKEDGSMRVFPAEGN